MSSMQIAKAESETVREVLETQIRPGEYRHWKLEVEGAVAWLFLDVEETGGLRPDYALKLNSYDLLVDMELADAVTRLRFEQPQVSVVVVTSAKPNVFSAGANIYMLRGASHPFKVNFCKYTNETRLAMEEATAKSGQTYLAALNGVTSGGGYELALACDEIHLVDDRISAVSLPEIPYLGVLPGTGGLTRLVDKRHVRRDRADVFSTLAEGIKGKRAVEWNLVDAVHPPSRWDEAIRRRIAARTVEKPDCTGISLHPLEKERTGREIRYRHVTLTVDPQSRTAKLTVRGPESFAELPDDPSKIGCEWYPLALFRELDDVLVELRFNWEEIGVILIQAEGDLQRVLDLDRSLEQHAGNWFVREVRLLIGRTLKRMDYTARTFFTLIEPGSCFGGFLLELALASDRIYMLNDDQGRNRIATTALNANAFPMGNGLSRLAQRFLAEPERAAKLAPRGGETYDAEAALAEGLVTAVPDEIDWSEEIRLAVEERAALSPDALSGMEASLRFAGPETMETKIFGRLATWQNWIFQRPNATGERGSLTLYGRPESPQFDKRRT